MHAELTLGLSLPINRKRVERLMRKADVQDLACRQVPNQGRAALVVLGRAP